MRTELRFVWAVGVLSLSACSKQPAEQSPAADSTKSTAEETVAKRTEPAGDGAEQRIVIDGSSTVYPISEALSEEFQKIHKARVTVAASGTGGGFKKFCSNEIAIAGASRPIKPSEVEQCKASAVEYIELPIAFDGIVVVVNPQNTWVDKLTVAELKKLWEPEAQGKVTHWSDLRPSWPKSEIHLFGAGVDSGTYDYFTKAIVGEEHKSRGDYTSSEDDNVLVRGVASDKFALGFFGLAYLEENQGAIKAVPIDDGIKEDGAGAIAPSRKTIEDATYQPLSRPLLYYVNRTGAEREEVQRFVGFALTDGSKLVNEVGYVSLPADLYKLVLARFNARKTGSIFAGEGSRVGVRIADLLANEK